MALDCIEQWHKIPFSFPEIAYFLSFSTKLFTLFSPHLIQAESQCVFPSTSGGICQFSNNYLTIPRSEACSVTGNKTLASSPATCCVLLLVLFLLQKTRNIFYFFKWKNIYFRSWGTYRYRVGVRQKKMVLTIIQLPLNVSIWHLWRKKLSLDVAG